MTELMTPAEVADALRVTVRHVYNLAADGKLDSIRIGDKTLRIKRASVEAMIDGS